VLDFGLAKLEKVNSDVSATVSDLTRPGMSMGTLAYISPEQARGEEVDARTDLFSLGRVLFEMITGRSMLPQGTTIAVMIDAILNQRPNLPSSINRGIPASIDDIVRKAIAREKSERYATAAKMRE
jgi:serine/threonine protein kinase